MNNNISQAKHMQRWVMIAICAVMVGMGYGAVVNIAVFLAPLEIAFNWSRADVSLAYGVANVAAGIGGVIMGHWSDRLPIRPLVVSGTLVTAIGFWFLSQVQ